MCGITGKIYVDRNRAVERALIESMKRCLCHRGPDETGLHIKGNAGIGFQRLSFIDLETGQQPIPNEDASRWIVFNGEIYNFHELRDDLIARGHVFKTKSDTETILHLHEEYGERCVEALRGMFAIAIWNERDQELFLARDRVGKKPLYYAITHDAIVFASEMKSILVDPEIRREIDPAALDQYLTLQYVPEPRTIFKGIQKLEPGHWLRWRAGAVRVERYWRLDYEPKAVITEAEACEGIRAHLNEAVRVRLESEVPLGCLLSGGIDSSAIVAFLRRHVSGTLRTFSIGFEEATFNELPFARMIAKKFETEHEELIVRPNAIEVLPRIVWHFDEPFADPSALPTYYVAELTRRHVKGVLSGDGGDESFAGYERYRGLDPIEKYRKIPRAIRALLGPLSRAALRAFPNAVATDRLNTLNELSLLPAGEQYAHYMMIFRKSQRSRLYADGWRSTLSHDPLEALKTAFYRSDIKEEIDRKMFTDIATYLPGDLLVKMDRMTMAHGLEARAPLLDHKLMEFAARLPGELKFKNRELKYLLKKALEPILPREVMYRPKQGFAVPLEAWFKSDLKEMMRDVLLSERARGRGFFDEKYIRRIVEEHVSGHRDHQHRLWSLLCFELWCRSFLDQPDPLAGPIRI